MAILDDIVAERQRLAERLVRIDAERARLANQLSELDATERVLSRFGGSKTAVSQHRRRKTRNDGAETAAPSRGGRAPAPPATAPTVPARTRQQRRGRRRAAAKPELSLGDATLRAVEALGNDVSAERIRTYLADELGLQVRPNHLGMSLQRHRRAGRLEQQGEYWSMPGHHTGEQVTAT